MTRLLQTLPIGGALIALAFVAAGCNPGADETKEASAAPPPATSASSGPAAAPRPSEGAAQTTGASRAALGASQTAGPFEVTLTTNPATPKEGDARLIVTVTRGGKPVEDAQVQVALSMPTMNMGGPTVELYHTKGGRYEGAARLGMGGAWQAKTTVSSSGAGSETGAATHDFSVSQ